MQPEPRLRVLFIHGLESGAQGRKVNALRQFFDVHCEDMRVSRFKSPFRNPWVAIAALWCMLLASLVLVSIFKYDLIHLIFASPFMVEMVMLGALAVAVTIILYRLSVRYAVNCCIEQQVRAIHLFRPDVIVGSSFGGAVAVFLLLRGLWSGPTLLLSPAQTMVAKHAAWTNPAIERGLQPFAGIRRLGNALAALERVLVVHGRYDQVIPFQHSVDLVHSWQVTMASLSSLPPPVLARPTTEPGSADLDDEVSPNGRALRGRRSPVDCDDDFHGVVTRAEPSRSLPASEYAADPDRVQLMDEDAHEEQLAAQLRPWIQLELIDDDHALGGVRPEQLKHWVLAVCLPEYELRARLRRPAGR